MTDYSYFKNLTPRQQFNDLMHKYAQETGGKYGDSWRELDRRWKAKHGNALSWLRWKHNQDHQTALTLPAYIEATGEMKEALAIGHEMTTDGLRYMGRVTLLAIEMMIDTSGMRKASWAILRSRTG